MSNRRVYVQPDAAIGGSLNQPPGTPGFQAPMIPTGQPTPTQMMPGQTQQFVDHESGATPYPNVGYQGAPPASPATGRMMGPGGVISTPTQGRMAIGGYPTPASPTSNVIPDVQITPQMQCSPTYMRVTMGCAPNNTTLMNKSGIPLGVIMHPLAKPADDDPIPVVNLAGGGIVRCRRCRSYINPFVAFSEGGRKWLCNLCGLPNDVHPEYYSPLDNLGRRTDLDQRPELQRGIVEFIASGEYTIRPPMPPSYMFVIDVSYQSVSTGVCYTVVETVKRLLDSFPGAPRTKIGFITYDSSVQFYNL